MWNPLRFSRRLYRATYACGVGVAFVMLAWAAAQPSGPLILVTVLGMMVLAVAIAALAVICGPWLATWVTVRRWERKYGDEHAGAVKSFVIMYLKFGMSADIGPNSWLAVAVFESLQNRAYGNAYYAARAISNSTLFSAMPAVSAPIAEMKELFEAFAGTRYHLPEQETARAIEGTAGAAAQGWTPELVEAALVEHGPEVVHLALSKNIPLEYAVDIAAEEA